MWSTTKRNEEINAFQRREILSLAAAGPERAQAESLRPHYTRIGEWLPGGTGERVLELGCGPGRYVALLGALGYDVVGVDPLLFPLWEEIKALRPVEFQHGIKAESLPFPDASFDHVACVSALLYFDDADKALFEMRRVLKPGGKLFMRTVSSTNLRRRFAKTNIDPAAKNYFDENELRAFLVKGGFEVTKTFSYGFFPPVMTTLWWYLCNGKIPLGVQEKLSGLTPPSLRVTAIAFAQLTAHEQAKD